jgi:hypothetical protein
MRESKRKKLGANGWKIGTPKDFLRMSNAKMEAGDPAVSLDLLVKSLFALGASNRELAAIISRR